MRLIDADKLPVTETWALVNSDNNSPEGVSFAPLSCILKKDIDTAPTVDGPHGEWVEGYHDQFETLDCSLCGYVRENRYSNFNFCPICGADMRGEE